MRDLYSIGEMVIDFIPGSEPASYIRKAGGAPANVAIAVTKNGLRSAMCCKVGEDDFGRFLMDTLAEYDVEAVCPDLCREAITTMAFVTLAENGERRFTFARKPGADMMLSEADVKETDIADSAIIHAGSCSLSAQPEAAATVKALRLGHEYGKLVSFDVNYRNLMWNDDIAACTQAVKEILKYVDLLKISEEEVDREIETVRKRNARKLSVEDRPAQKGDTANIDYEGFLDAEKTTPFEGGKGENHDLELGSGSFVPGFEDQVIGMSVGEEKDINITFPENYAKDLAGKDVVFHVKVNGITYPELPEPDDDFAQDVSEFDTFEEYKASIRKDLEERRSEQAKAAFRNAALEKACENLKAELPETMVKAHIESIIRNFANNYGVNGQNMQIETLASMLGIDEEAMNTAIRPNAERETKLELLVNAVIDAENIEGTEEEIDAYVEKISGSVGAPAEQIRKYFGKDYILSEFKKEKAMDIIADSAVAVDPAPKAAEEEPAAEPEKKETEEAAE